MSLYQKFATSSKLVIPNYTPAGWFECDLYRVTKSGYAEEFEIKISVGDFNADAKKGPSEHQLALARYFKEVGHPRGATFEERTKHQRLEAGDIRGPSRFWFVVPLAIGKAVEGLIPEWAGLMVRSRGYPIIIRQARQLHRQKVDPKIEEHVRGVFYHRYWTLKQRMPDQASAVDSGSSEPYDVPDWQI